MKLQEVYVAAYERNIAKLKHDCISRIYEAHGEDDDFDLEEYNWMDLIEIAEYKAIIDKNFPNPIFSSVFGIALSDNATSKKDRTKWISLVEKQIGRKFNGSIVIVELDNDLIFERKKVLYKKHMTLFKEITKNRKFMIALESRDYLNACKAKTDNRPYRRLFSEFFSKELRFHCCSEDKFKRISGQWRNAIKESKYYYDYVRIILKEYEERYKGLGLDSLDVIYSKYLNNIENKKQSRKMTEIKMELEDLTATTPKDSLSKDLLSHLSDYEEPKRYRTYADEEGYPGDLEPGGQDSLLDNETSGVERGKTKTLSNGHSILFVK